MTVTGDGLRFTLARTVDLVAVSPGPRPARPDALPAHVRLVDLATAGELAELAVSEGEPRTDRSGEPGEPDTGSLDGLIARAEARLGGGRSDGTEPADA